MTDQKPSTWDVVSTAISAKSLVIEVVVAGALLLVIYVVRKKRRPSTLTDWATMIAAVASVDTIGLPAFKAVWKFCCDSRSESLAVAILSFIIGWGTFQPPILLLVKLWYEPPGSTHGQQPP